MAEGYTNLEAIAYLSTQPEGLWDITPHKTKRSLNQNSLYWMAVGIIAKALKKPNCYIHNLLLRRCEIYEQIDGKVVCVPLPDTDEAELWAEYHELYHYKPTLERFTNTNGTEWRWYKVLKGSKEYNMEEMARLIDIAIDQLESMGLMLPQDAATVKALEEHEKIKSERTHK